MQLLKKRKPGEPLHAALGAPGAKRPMMPVGMPPEGMPALPSVPLVRVARLVPTFSWNRRALCLCLLVLCSRGGAPWVARLRPPATLLAALCTAERRRVPALCIPGVYRRWQAACRTCRRRRYWPRG